ncbi:ribonuclease HII [Alicyclobacillus pomorum]|uniref:ribonuclease HII n=1 Tax=Alicyclobacillus pomorum TaxID=204470 RepID=UPI00040EB4D1|nr:ribonuclease HII [Alicyclobacillus pomorum]
MSRYHTQSDLAHASERALEMFEFERSLAGTTSTWAGVDEAGRGALAGPVVAAAVILGTDPALFAEVNDSKTLTRVKRERLYDHIVRHALAVGVGMASVEEIDRYNILHASRMAMARALSALDTDVALALVDGTYSPLYEGPAIPSIPVVDGDAKCLSIAAASIVAKVHRDRLMAELGDIYPQYGFAQNAGYGTPVHLKALDEHGPTACHRRSFAPVQRYLQARLDI